MTKLLATSLAVLALCAAGTAAAPSNNLKIAD